MEEEEKKNEWTKKPEKQSTFLWGFYASIHLLYTYDSWPKAHKNKRRTKNPCVIQTTTLFKFQRIIVKHFLWYFTMLHAGSSRKLMTDLSTVEILKPEQKNDSHVIIIFWSFICLSWCVDHFPGGLCRRENEYEINLHWKINFDLEFLCTIYSRCGKSEKNEPLKCSKLILVHVLRVCQRVCLVPFYMIIIVILKIWSQIAM